MSYKILELKGIKKNFGQVKALKNINLELKNGEVHALLGENGAGKSTLIKILTGAIERTEGVVIYNGVKIGNLTPNETQKIGIRAIYQELTLFDELEVYKNIFMGQEIKNIMKTNDSEMIKKSKEILEKLGLKINPKEIVKNLSIADKQMIEIARAIMFEAKILIMDEPTSSISEKEVKTLFKIVRELKKNGITIIYITHKMEEIINECDRVTIMRDGESIETLEITNKTNKEELVDIMVGKKIGDFYPKRIPNIGKTILEVENLGIKNLFEGVNFKLSKGEILGIGGLVGSKRSEIVETIFGLRKRDFGKIKYKNEEVNFKTPSDAILNKIGFITEDRKKTGIFKDLGIRENITMALLENYKKQFQNIDIKKEEKDVLKYIKRLNIKTPHMEQKIKNLSGGNQQKALIARWLLENPNILIMDEPTRGIDVKAKSEIYNLMCELTSQGVSIIMISSEIPELIAMSDRVLVMREGKVAGTLSENAITEENILKLSFGGEINE